MTYLRELRLNWRALFAAAIGMGAGLSINLYVTSIFTPYILADFGWSDSEFALVGTTTIVVLFCMPIIGRLRSEEHTSELQSLMRISYAVFCLKKKTKSRDNITHLSCKE